MKLSVIIVNYNVKYFLEQCLYAVLKASVGMKVETIVVDNNSVDGSCQMVREKFPEIKLIENKVNLGFSKANNQAIRDSNGEYILLLNPDTVVDEDSFNKIIEFMDSTPDAGGLGVKMIDGKGRFLPESKRGLPTPLVAFYKIFGLSKLFPHSKRFSRYHLGYLDKDNIHEVDVLAGAFMLLRRKTLDEVGLLDEDYFMYGEDIDLSYRITQGGYKNYYFPETTIIHYKGESTKKGSINYVKVFYHAMSIFAEKHFSRGNARLFSTFINMAIYFRAFLAILSRIFKSLLPLTLDVLAIYSGYLLLLPYWEEFRFEKGYYPPEYLNIAVPIYILIWLLSIGISGGYKKPVKIFKIARGIFWGSLSILIFYSLIDESMRFSRALIILGSIWAFLTLLAYRYLFHKLGIKSFQLAINEQKRVVIIASSGEASRISELVKSSGLKIEIIGYVSPSENTDIHDYLGSLKQLPEIIRINKIDELIFSSSDIPTQEIIRIMLDLSTFNIDYKIAPPESHSIIGSNSISTAGDLYVVQINSIAKESNQRNKRILDIIMSILFLLLSPVLLWMVNPKGLFVNIFSVLSGKISWVGYIPEKKLMDHLPPIKKGILSSGDKYAQELSPATREELNVLYAKDYHLYTDIEIILNAWRKIGKL